MNGKRWILRIFKTLSIAFACYLVYELPFASFIPIQRSEHRLPPTATPDVAERIEIRDRVAKLLSRIESLRLERYADEGPCNFRPPALESDIQAIEDHTGFRLPEDFRAYLELHDGQEHNGSFYGYQPLLSCNEILSQSRDLLAIYSTCVNLPLCHQGAWFHPAALIFEESDGGGYAINAFTGEIYSWDHDGGFLQRKAESFTGFLEVLAACLEAGDG